jgi:hypothetical protein
MRECREAARLNPSELPVIRPSRCDDVYPADL